MRLADLTFLLSQEGQNVLDRLAGEAISAETHLKFASQLRERFDPTIVYALLETAMLRQRGASKFSRASQMYFTRQGLEQASGEVIAAFRAERFRELGIGQVADLGCGIGGDAIALTTAAEVIGIDWDPLRLAMAQENVRVYGRSERFHPMQSDLIELKPLHVDALYCDPGRRDEHGRRIYKVEEYRPPLSFLTRWQGLVPDQCVKVSPGVDYRDIPKDVEVEFISVSGEVREGVFWRGDLRTAPERRATLLPGAHTLTSDQSATSLLAEIGDYLVEPDGAVVRAHLVEQLAYLIGAAKIDLDIAYLSADRIRPTPFGRFFPVEDVFPFQLKKLRSYLRQRDVGAVTIKKRGSPIDIEMLERRLKLQGTEHRVVFLTRASGKPVVVVARSPIGEVDDHSAAVSESGSKGVPGVDR